MNIDADIRFSNIVTKAKFSMSDTVFVFSIAISIIVVCQIKIDLYGYFHG